MTTILDALQKGTGYLEKHGVESARLTMQHLLAHVTGVNRMQLYVDFDQPLDEGRLVKLRELMKDRAAGRPLQHLLGTVEFFDREFLCDERALIPRPETEFLVDLLAKRSWPEEVRILDMGCGSGVIGLSLARALCALRPEVTLADVSAEALTLAAENAGRLTEDLEGCGVRFVESDLFSRLEGGFDLLVANLPYLTHAEMGALSREVSHDPALALDGGERGVEVMERFLGEASAHARDGATVALEFGLGQGPALSEAARSAGWTGLELVHDLEGKERFLLGRKA